jgi:hypothetical protein
MPSGAGASRQARSSASFFPHEGSGGEFLKDIQALESTLSRPTRLHLRQEESPHSNDHDSRVSPHRSSVSMMWFNHSGICLAVRFEDVRFVSPGKIFLESV